jgi:hypothetical protein
MKKNNYKKGFDIHGNACKFPWCVPCKKMIKHLTQCYEPETCVVCNPWFFIIIIILFIYYYYFYYYFYLLLLLSLLLLFLFFF